MQRVKNNTKQYIIGAHCVRQVLKKNPERLLRVYSSCPKNDDLLQKLSNKKVPIVQRDKKKLDLLATSSSHQGYVAEVKPRKTHTLDTFLASSLGKKKSLVLMLDAIFDPQNVGAILRACECFAVDAVIFSKNRGCSITPTVSKTSVGASEIVPIIEVSNLGSTLKKMQQEKYNYWSVVAEVSPRATKLAEFSYPDKTVLILGSEGRGVQKHLSQSGDFHIYIPII